MATNLALGDIIRVRIACYTANQQGINVVHFRVSNVAGTAVTDAAVAAALNTVYAPRYKACLSEQARYRGVSVQRIKPLPATFPQIVTSSDGVGTVTGDMMSTQTSGIISSQTNFAGAKYRGRVYIPFPGEDDNDVLGVPENAYVTNIDDLGDELFTSTIIGTAPNETTLVPGIYHRADQTFTDITNFVARQKWATQRRRGSYGKTNPTPF